MNWNSDIKFFEREKKRGERQERKEERKRRGKKWAFSTFQNVCQRTVFETVCLFCNFRQNNKCVSVTINYQKTVQFRNSVKLTASLAPGEETRHTGTGTLEAFPIVIIAGIAKSTRFSYRNFGNCNESDAHLSLCSEKSVTVCKAHHASNGPKARIYTTKTCSQAARTHARRVVGKVFSRDPWKTKVSEEKQRSGYAQNDKNIHLQLPRL